MKHAVDDLHRIGLKLFVKDGTQIQPRELVPIFHGWIQTGAIDQHVIDVADYAHLHEGPGVVLVAHEGNFALDYGGGRLGLLYYRKQPAEGPLPARLAAVCRILVKAATLLEGDPALAGRIRFRGEELELVANDRFLAPSSDEAFDAMRLALSPLVARLYPATPWAITRNPDSRERLTLTIRAARPTTLAALADRLT
jgi:hypothetical protein